jgi:hypothetical protein
MKGLEKKVAEHEGEVERRVPTVSHLEIDDPEAVRPDQDVLGGEITVDEARAALGHLLD